MSILIKGMNMPDSCFHCKLADVCQHYKAEHYANKRHEDCPLEEVPETHDKRTETHSCDLIERQAVLNLFPTHDWKHLYNAVKELPSAELATNLQQSCNQLATDCISRQAAIDDFTKWQYQLADCFGEDYSGVSIVESAIKSLEGYPSAQPEQRWIPVSERLPEEDFWNGSEVQTSNFVLIAVQDTNSDNAIVDYGYTSDGVWKSETCVIDIPDDWKVTAWMPLPEPYQAERREDGYGKHNA